LYCAVGFFTPAAAAATTTAAATEATKNDNFHTDHGPAENGNGEILVKQKFKYANISIFTPSKRVYMPFSESLLCAIF